MGSAPRSWFGFPLALAALTLLAAALRLPFLDHQSLWFDEVFTRDIVGEPSLSALWHHVQATESTPPLFYLVEWLCGGQGAVAMRLIPALALIAAVPVGCLAFRPLIGERAALATAAILAVSPNLVQFSLDARAYGLLVLTALLSLWGFAELLESSQPRRYALWVLACIACVWTHYFGAFVVAAETALLVYARPRARRQTLAATAAIAAFIAPLIPLVVNQTGDDRAAFIAGLSLGTRLTSTLRQFAMGANVPRTWLEAVGLVLACGGAFTGAALAARAGERRGRARILLALAAITFAAPLALASLGIQDSFYERNLVATLPLVAALAAPALLMARGAPLALYLAVAAAASIWTSVDWRYQVFDWRGAVARIEAIDPRAAVVTTAPFSEPVARAYLRRGAAHAPVLARHAWLAVQPVRAAHHRDLGPGAPAPSSLPGFTPLRELDLHAFRLILLGAPQPTRIAPGQPPGAVVFPGR
jgi:4-amino-4-deoxy-L-arabinose transferase-like glycosyltransferase